MRRAVCVATVFVLASAACASTPRARVAPRVEPRAEDRRHEARAFLHALKQPNLPRLGRASACDVHEGRVRCWKADGPEDIDPDGHDVYAITELTDVVDLAVGTMNDEGCALARSGRIGCWELPVRSTPGPLAVTASWTVPNATRLVVDGFAQRLCVIAREGRVSCWKGRDAEPPESPRPVVTENGKALEGVVEIGLGEGHACARRAAGEVLCWGDNDQGQLGVGYRPGRRQARAVVGLPPATRLAVADHYGCALAADGVVRCWGTLFGGAFSGEDRGSWEPRPLRAGCAMRDVKPGGYGSLLLLRSTGALFAYGYSGGADWGWSFALRMSGVEDATSNGDALCAKLRDRAVCWKEDADHGPPLGIGPGALPVTTVPTCPGSFDALPAVPAYGFTHFASARAFVFNRKGERCEEPFSKSAGGPPRPCESLEGKGVPLVASDLEELKQLVSDRRTFTGSVVQCFDPHHAFVLYDDAGKPVSWLTLCFECRKLLGSDPVPASVMGQSSYPESLSDDAVHRLEALVARLGLPRVLVR